MNANRINLFLLAGLLALSFAHFSLNSKKPMQNENNPTVIAEHFYNEHDEDHDDEHLIPVMLMIEDQPNIIISKDDHDDEHGENHLISSPQEQTEHDDDDKDHH